MATSEHKKGTIPRGPVSDQVAANIKEVREARGRASLTELAEAATELGRPMLSTAIHKIERKTRQISVDDLVTLAVALGVNPSRLLLPSTEQDVELTPTTSVGFADAWRWALGTEPVWAGPYAPEKVTTAAAARNDFERHTWPASLRMEKAHPAMAAANDVLDRVDDLLKAVTAGTASAATTKAVELSIASLRAEVAKASHKAALPQE